ncbi:MAG: hypothetical protein OYH77_03685, partial [Pseudomonadota bacterium]|nr:hypothetical protein [Pseudomonadota bacterium]
MRKVAGLILLCLSSNALSSAVVSNPLRQARANLLQALRAIGGQQALPVGRNGFEYSKDSIVASSLTGDFYQSRSGYAEELCGNSSWCAWSDAGAGYKLTSNQDGYVVRKTDSSLALAVFDGISTAAGGEIATEVAINTVSASDEPLY